MAYRIFGSDYPPGCNSVPGDHDEPCEVCGGMINSGCICSPCEVCGEIGDPYCFKEHGMTLTEKQQEQIANCEREWEEQAKDAELHAKLDTLLWEED